MRDLLDDPDRDANHGFVWLALGILSVFAVVVMLLFGASLVFARDDGRFANSALHAWFDKLASGKGLCCSVADGRTVDDPDVEMSGGHYRVRVDGQWLAVPDDALVTEPNKYGLAVVWPVIGADGKMAVRCFLPASGV
jgi:hypothetical protein